MNCLLRSFVVTIVFFVLPQFLIAQGGPPDPSDGADGCELTSQICDITTLDGYMAATSASGPSNVCPFDAPSSTCMGSTCENNIWFSFQAWQPNLQLTIDPSNCTGGGTNGSGLQGALYQVSDCNSTNGFEEVAPCFSMGGLGADPPPFTLNATNLIVGEIYTIMLDGFAGSICDFEISLPFPPPPIPPIVQLPYPIEGPFDTDGSLITGNLCVGAIVEVCIPLGIGVNPEEPFGYDWDWSPSPNFTPLGPITDLGLNAAGTQMCAQVEINASGVGFLQVTASNQCAESAPTSVLLISDPPTQNFEFMTVCNGDEVEWLGNTYFPNFPGTTYYETTYNDLGCPIENSLQVIVLPVIPLYEYAEICQDELPYEWNGNSYDEGGLKQATYVDANGCTSTTSLDLVVYNAEAIIQPPGLIGCGVNSSIILDASNSTVDAESGAVLSYLWTGPGIVGVDTSLTVEVNQAGEYTFEVTHTNNTGTIICTGSSSVIVGEDVAFPDAPGLTGLQEICGSGQTVSYEAIAANTGVQPTGYTWTVSNGIITEAGNMADVQWNGVGEVCVAAFNDCDTSTYTCLNVIVEDLPVLADIVGPLVACETNDAVIYTVDTINADWIYTWDLVGDASFTNQGDSIIVDFTGASNVEIVVSAENNCGSSNTLSSVIALTVLPTDPIISGDPIVCAGDTATYSIPVAADITLISETISGGSGTILSGDGTGSIEVVWNTPGTDQVCFEVENSCGPSNEVCFDVEVTQLPTATFTDQTFNFCPGENEEQEVAINLTGVGPWDVEVTELGSNTVLNFNLINSSDFITLPQEGVYEITNVSDANLCTGTGLGQITIEPFIEPTAILSGSGGICEDSGDCVTLEIVLTGTPNWSVEYEIDNLVFTINGIDASPYILEICQPGTVELVSVQDANCFGSASGSVIIDDLGSPVASNISVDCDINTGLTYEVSFDIVGGNGIYTVQPLGSGTLTGSTFVSNPILSGETYSFDIFDTNNCAVETVSGVTVCNCANDVGTMDQTLLVLCDPECADAGAGYSNTEVLGSGDILQFVLHEGSGLSIEDPIAFNTNGEFCFDAVLGMNYGQTYYVSAITGDDDGTGNVDLNDLCLAVSQGTPVVFYEVPQANIGSNGSICIGETYSINVDFTAGTGPYTLVYEDGNTNLLDTINTNDNPFVLEVSPSLSTDYTFVMVSTPNCSNSLNTTVEVEVYEAPTFTTPVTSCNSTADAFTVSFDIIGGNPTTYEVISGIPGTITGSTFTSDAIPSGSTYFFELTNGQCDTLEISTTNPINCPCLSEVGDFDSTALVSTCGDGPIDLQYNPALGNGQNLDGNDVLGFILYEGNATTVNSVLANNNTASFSLLPSMDYGQSYFIAAAVANADANGNPDLTDACLAITDGVEIVFYEVPTVNMVGDTSICNGESTNLTLEFTGDAPFEVVITDGNSNDTLSGIVSSPFFYEVSPSVTTSYELVSGSDENCVANSSGTAIVNVNSAPIVVGDPIETINNDNTHIDVTINIDGGNSSYYIITLANGDTIQEPSNQFVFDSIPCGNGYYFEIDDPNACGPVIISEPATDCPCLTNAGTIDETLIEVCDDFVDFASFYDDSSVSLDGNDIIQFILHDGSYTPLLPASSSPDFTFANPLEYGQTYYVSSIAGDEDLNGSVDLNDPCYDVDGLGSVIFYEEPSAILTGGGDICLFDSTALYVEFIGGAGPWTIVVEDINAQEFDTIELANAIDSFFVDPLVTTTFELISVTDDIGLCNGVDNVAGQAFIQVNSIPYAGTPDIVTDFDNETVTVINSKF